MSKPTITIGVVSDVVCPWCYIGKRRLEKAIGNLSDKFNFEVEYLPFELNPGMPQAGVDQKDYLTTKFGGERRYRELTGNVAAIAAQEGLTFDFEAQKVSPNTRDAHRLIQLAREDGLQEPVVEALYKAYFSEGIDLSKTDNLKAVAVSAGMHPQKVDEFLAGNTGAAMVEMAEREFAQLGITGVPFFIINNKYGVSGAQPAESFEKVFTEIGETANSAQGETCDPEKQNC